MIDRIVEVLVVRRKGAATLAMALIAILIASAPNLAIDPSLDDLAVDDNPHQALADTIAERFAARSVMQIGVYVADGPVTELLEGMRELDRRIRDLDPGLQVRSIHSLSLLLPTLGVHSDASAGEALSSLLGAPLFDQLVGADTASTLALVFGTPGAGTSLDEVGRALEDLPPGIDSVTVFSLMHLERDLRASIGADLGALTLLGLGAALLIFLVSYPSAAGLLFVGMLSAVSIVAAVWSLGTVDPRITMATMLLFPLAAVLALADAVHVLTGFHAASGPVDVRIRHALRRYIVPSFLTSATTLVAFLSLMLMPAAAMSALGRAGASTVALSFVLTYLLAPALLGWLGPRVRTRSWLQWSVRHLERGFVPVGGTLVIVSTLAVARLGDLNFSTPSDHFFPRGTPATAAFERLATQGFARPSLDVLVRPSSGTSPAVVLDRVSSAIAAIEGVQRVLSQRDVAAQLALTGLPVAAGSVGHAYATPEGDLYRLEVRLESGADAVSVAAAIDRAVEEETTQAWIRPTGALLAVEHVNRQVTSGLLRSFLISTLFVVLVVGGVTWSLRGAVVGAIANLAPVAAAVLLFAWSGLELSVLSASVLVLAMGLVVDDTVHALYRVSRADGHLEELAYSMTTTTLVLAGGFAAFTSSAFAPVRILGGVMAVILLVALIADLAVVPRLFKGRARAAEF